MNKINNNENGFSVIELVLVVLVVALLGVIGWLVYRNQTKTTSTTPTVSTTTLSPYLGWKTYCDSSNIGCFKYPPSWLLHTDTLPTSSYVADVQLTPPKNSPNMLTVMYNLYVRGPGTYSGVIAKKPLNTPINGMQVVEGVFTGTTAPYITLGNNSGSMSFTKGNFNWSLSVNSDSTFKTAAEATSWLSTPQAKDASLVLESFYYQ